MLLPFQFLCIVKVIFRVHIFSAKSLNLPHLKLKAETWSPFVVNIAIISNTFCTLLTTYPVGWGCRTHTLRLCWGVTPAWVSWYDTKQSDGEVPVMLELWGMQSTPSLPSLPGPLWPRVVAPDRVLSMSQIEVNCVLMLNWIVWNWTVLIFKCV